MPRGLARLGAKHAGHRRSFRAGRPEGRPVLDPPPLINAIGNTAPLGHEIIAVLDPRNASALGLKLAGFIAANHGEASGSLGPGAP
jgi:hypothetical protein